VQLRNPHATRPWQHVLEPLSGYLRLAAELHYRNEFHGEPFNFGPPSHQNHTVLELVEEMSRHWPKVSFEDISESAEGPNESGLLKLNCDKALHLLRWQAQLSFEETVRMTAEWYCAYYKNPNAIRDITLAQIREYETLAQER
jgi:CDP-glucose 4,6-dehydratase